MRRIRALLVRLLGVFNGKRADRDIEEEIQSHLAMHIDDNLRAGMSAEDARRAALTKLGGVQQVVEAHRDRRGVPLVEHVIQDVRGAVRMLRKAPGFTAVAVLTLGLGIGANAAIFSVVNAVLLRPLPFPSAGRLVFIFATNMKSGVMEDVGSYPDFEDWKAGSTSFDGMAAFTTRGATLTGDGQAELVSAVQATSGFFTTLGVSPIIGRTFRTEEQVSGAHIVVLSHGAWKRYFAGRDDIVGQTMRVNEQPYTVVGVMPAGFTFSLGEPEQIYTPMARDPNRGHGFLRVIGRLRPRASIGAAQSEMSVIARRIAAQYPKSNRDTGANVVPLVDGMVGKVKAGLLIFLGVVTLVLLIACTNVANLMLARNAARQRELAVRAALGAGRARLIQQLLTESAVLGLAGGAVGLCLASWTASILATVLAKNFPIPRIETTRTDAWVLGFTLVVSLATAMLFGTLHAVGAASPDLNEGLRESGRSVTGGVRGRRTRTVLVVTETALALVLLAGAGSLLKSLLVLRATAPGFNTENVLTVNFWLPKSRLASPPDRMAFFDQLVTRVGTLPGVRAAALVANPPLGNDSDSLGFHIPGRPDPPDGMHSANFNIVTAGYFRTLGIPMRAGREFTGQDVTGTPAVVVINQTAARRFWPRQDPLGKHIVVPAENGAAVTLTVIGVAGDVRQMGLGRVPEPEIFLDYLQPGPPWPWLSLVVRAGTDPMALAGSIKGVARSLFPDVPISQIRTVDDVISGSLAQPRVYTLLLGVFAALALALAAVGLYGVVSYTVTQRTHEMGIRLALGAEPGDVVRLVLRHGLRFTLVGTVLGLAAALALTRVLTRLMPGVHPNDPVTLLEVAALLIGVALVASYLPARRGSRVDPLAAVRHE